jgi:type IV secretory pathway VirB4 component
MQTQTAAPSKTKNRSTRGRKDENRQEKIITLAPVKERIGFLVKLYKEAASSAEALSEDIKAVAEKAGINASALRKFVTARASEKFEERKRYCEQLNLLFEDIGE